MAGQKNLANRIDQRRKGAASRLEARLELSNAELAKTAKSFRGQESVGEADINKYRASMKAHLQFISSKIMN